MGTQTQRLSYPWACHKGIQWNGGTAPPMLYLSTVCRWVINFTLQHLYP